MRKLSVALSLVALAPMVGCVLPIIPGPSWGPAPAGGWLFSEVTYPHARTAVVNEGVGPKRGEAMAKTILGLVSVGDAGIEAAMEDGGINRVYTVDHKLFSILGVYAEWTTIVTGD